MTSKKRCVPCPSGLIKSTYGNEYSLCESPEIGTGKIIIITACAVLFISLSVVYTSWKHTGSWKKAVAVLVHPVMINATSFAMDILDLGSDVINCTSIFHSLNPLFISYRGEYIVALVISVCTCVASMAIRVYAIRSLWAYHEHERSSRGGRRMSITKDHAQPIVRDVDVQRARLQSTKDLVQAFYYFKVQKWLVYSQLIVSVTEDLPMAWINTSLFLSMIRSESVVIQMLREEKIKVLMILFSIISSSTFGVYKLSKLKDLPNIWGRIDIVEEERARRNISIRSPGNESSTDTKHVSAAAVHPINEEQKIETKELDGVSDMLPYYSYI